MSSQYDKAKWIPSSNYNQGRKNKITKIVIHITDGQEKLENSVDWLCNKESKVSAHFVIGRNGDIVQLVKIEDKAWHAGEANSYSVGIEHCARSPGEWGKTDKGLLVTEEQYKSSAELVRWLCSYLNLSVDREHIKGHCELVGKDGKFISNHRDCPNKIWDWDKYMKLI